MPASSPEQKQLMCAVLAYKKHGESAIKGMRNIAQIKKMASEMTEEQLVDYCGSKVKK